MHRQFAELRGSLSCSRVDFPTAAASQTVPGGHPALLPAGQSHEQCRYQLGCFASLPSCRTGRLRNAYAGSGVDRLSLRPSAERRPPRSERSQEDAAPHRCRCPSHALSKLGCHGSPKRPAIAGVCWPAAGRRGSVRGNPPAGPPRRRPARCEHRWAGPGVDWQSFEARISRSGPSAWRRHRRAFPHSRVSSARQLCALYRPLSSVLQLSASRDRGPPDCGRVNCKLLLCDRLQRSETDGV